MSGRALLAVAAALLMGVLLPASAGAGPYKVKDLQAISGPSPFAAGCPGGFHDETKITGHEIEPAITVNPANPRNIVATWKQDVGPFNGRGRSRRLLARRRQDVDADARSPASRVCTGGTADTASDPWVSAGGDGTVYFGGQAGRHLDRSAADRDRRQPLARRRAQLGGAGDGRPPSRRATRRLRSPAVPRSPGTPTWPGPTSSRSTLPRTNTARVLAHDRRRRQLVAPRPHRPGQARSPSTSHPGSSSCRTGRCWRSSPAPTASRARHAPGRALARRGADVAAGRAGRSPSRSQTFFDPETGDMLPQPGYPERGGRAGRHRLHRLRGQHVRELGRDRRGQVAGRRSHLEHAPRCRA